MIRVLSVTEHDDYGELVVSNGPHEARFRFPIETGPLVNTIRGALPMTALRREVVIADRTQDLSVAIEWFADDGELVRRDAHVITKHPSVAASALAATFG